jgi:hypothetical protein
MGRFVEENAQQLEQMRPEGLWVDEGYSLQQVPVHAWAAAPALCAKMQNAPNSSCCFPHTTLIIICGISRQWTGHA